MIIAQKTFEPRFTGFKRFTGLFFKQGNREDERKGLKKEDVCPSGV
jgi:hypothetical protein